MIKRNFSITRQRLKYVACDYVCTFVAFLLFNIFRYYFLQSTIFNFQSPEKYLFSATLIGEQIIVPFALLAFYWLSGYYNRPLEKSRLEELTTTFYNALLSSLIIFFVLLINDTTGVRTHDYELLLVCFGLLFIFTYSGRLLITYQVIKQLRKHNRTYSTLIVGNSRKSREVYKKLKESGSVWAFDVIGFIRLDKEHQINDGMPVWDISEIVSLCEEKNIDQIILAPEQNRDAEIMKILDKLFPLNVSVKIAPDTISYITSNIRLNDILGVPFVDLTSPRISECQKNIKRCFDIFASLLTMIILCPLLITTGLIVKLGSPGPILYRQKRMGKNRKVFTIYKFRSMHVNAESEGPQLSSENDSRITPFGKIMRKYRIDELPQFWNVLKGDMSLVGPRPEREYYVNQIVKHAPYYSLVFQVRPGVTSWGMVKYGYASSVNEMVKRSKYDLIYLNNMSLSTDMKILIYTIRTVLSGEGK